MRCFLLLLLHTAAAAASSSSDSVRTSSAAAADATGVDSGVGRSARALQSGRERHHKHHHAGSAGAGAHAEAAHHKEDPFLSTVEMTVAMQRRMLKERLLLGLMQEELAKLRNSTKVQPVCM